MDPKNLEVIKKNLVAELDRLEHELGGFAKQDEKIKDNYRSAFPEFGATEEDNAAEVADFSDRLSLEHTLEEMRRDVKRALADIASGTYGICRHCGQPIEEQRLLIRPTSSSCIACKKRLQGEA